MGEVREVLAKAISGAPFPSKASLGKADRVLTALADAGFAVVPREPTEEMVRVGDDALEETEAFDFDVVREHPSPKIWQAMIAATGQGK